jgi:chromosome segregation ATPase
VNLPDKKTWQLSKLKARLSSEEQARSSMKEEFEARLSSEEKARSSMKEEFEGKQNAMEKVSEARRNSHLLEVKEVSAARDSLAKQVEELNAKIKEMQSSVSSAGDQAAKDRDLSSAKDREVAKAVEELERVRSSIPKLIKEEAERLEKKHAEEMSKLKAGKGKDMAEAAEELDVLKRSIPELIKEEAERLEKKHAEEINEVNTRHRQLNQDLTQELAKARNAEVSMRGNVEKLEGQLGAMQREMDDAKHRQARELEIAKQQAGEYMAKGAADALENSELKMKLVAEKDLASAR